jgi:hypothetical protein
MNDLLAEARAFARARPIRVAFLIEEGPHAHEMLDATFAESFGRWGGRYSLICPCVDGFPRAAYLPWLRTYDPDIIMSWHDLDDQNLQRLRELVGPAYLMRCGPESPSQEEPTRYRAELPLPALNSLSVTLQYASGFPASAPQPMHVVDCLPGQPADRFIDDNFGTALNSYGRNFKAVVLRGVSRATSLTIPPRY